MIYLLFVLLCTLLFMSYRINNKEISSPSVIFTLGFTFSTFWAVIYSKRWKLGLHFNTFFIIFFGAFLFIITSWLVKCTILKKNSNEYSQKKIEIINISFIKKIFFLIFASVMTILCLYFTVKSVGGDINNIRTSLYKYRNLTEFKNVNISIPFVISASMGIIHCSAYWFMYVFINNYLKNKKIDIITLIIVIVCGASNLIEGNRGGIINFILAVVPMYIILKKRNEGKLYKINKKTVIIAIISATILLFGLQSTARMIGRDDVNNISTMDYIAMYSGAEIKNLDLLLQKNIETSNTFGRNIFSTFITQLAKIFEFGIEEKITTGSFNAINGFNLGNAYTIYSSFILDFDYWSFIPIIFVLAFVMQLLYERCKYDKMNNSIPNIHILIYSYVFGGLVFSFFGNKLFNQMISFSFLEYIIMWHLLNYILVKIKN